MNAPDTKTAEHAPLLPLTWGEAMGVLKAIKLIAAADGLSHKEEETLHRRLEAIDVGPDEQQILREFDTDSKDLETFLTEHFATDPTHARYLLISAVAVAQVDGYSEAEAASVRHLAERLGVSPGYVRAVEAVGRLGAVIWDRDDDELADGWRELRDSLLVL